MLNIIIISILSTALYFIIMYFVISAATDSRKRIDLLNIQIKLLVKIAQSQNVPAKEIEKVTGILPNTLMKDSSPPIQPQELSDLNNPQVLENLMGKFKK